MRLGQRQGHVFKMPFYYCTETTPKLCGSCLSPLWIGQSKNFRIWTFWGIFLRKAITQRNQKFWGTKNKKNLLIFLHLDCIIAFYGIFLFLFFALWPTLNRPYTASGACDSFAAPESGRDVTIRTCVCVCTCLKKKI